MNADYFIHCGAPRSDSPLCEGFCLYYNPASIPVCSDVNFVGKGVTMSLLEQLSSQVGDRSEEANREAAALCLADPSLLAEIAAGLPSKDVALVADCAEVLTMVAQERPALVAPYAPALAGLLTHKHTRSRWEATHALALVADLVPAVIAPLLPQLAETLGKDKSVIVRDYTVDMLGGYGRTSADAARAALPLLQEALTLWDGKQAARVLNALAEVGQRLPSQAAGVRAIGQRFSSHPRSSVSKAAKQLLKKLAWVENA
jgi:hypothetical protein